MQFNITQKHIAILLGKILEKFMAPAMDLEYFLIKTSRLLLHCWNNLEGSINERKSPGYSISQRKY